MKYWWVNQNQTWQFEVNGGYMWSPKFNANGRQNPHYNNMVKLDLGDLVFSYYSGAIQSVGIVTRTAVSSRKPDFNFVGSNWSDDGWEVLLHYVVLPSAINPRDYLDIYKEHAPLKLGPMNGEGRVNQAYLFELPTEVGDLYLALSNLRANDLGSDVLIDDASETMLLEAQAVLNDQTLTSTERQVLTSARIGQGLFKAQVGRIEPSCRLTGLSIPERLIASHMKPWKESTNDERLSAFNGLLMSPHVDHLFDRGLITFEETGAIVVSKELSPAVNVAWKLDFGMKGKPFTREQIPFLEYHQSEVFKS